MAEVLARFNDVVADGEGRRYRAQACGAPNADGLWDGWIEFVPLDGGTVLRSPRETTQPNGRDAAYWASGLTAIYLEGALDRALNPPLRRTTAPAEPLFDGPAPTSALKNPPLLPSHVIVKPGAGVSTTRGLAPNTGAAHQPIKTASDIAHARTKPAGPED